MTFDDLALNAQTAAQLASFIERPSHAVALIGPTGSGKYNLATQLAKSILQIKNLSDYPYATVIRSEDGNKAIGIEAVRQLDQFLKLKVPTAAAVSRVVIIADAQLLTLEAQNAILKTLEEPPAGTLIILTVDQQQSLRPTILSRCQVIMVGRPSRSRLEKVFSSYPKPEFSQAYAVSGGLPGLMHSLLSDEDHPLGMATKKAREVLGQTVYERLLAVDELAKQRSLAAGVTLILQQMAHVSLQTATGASAKKWQNILEASYEAAEVLQTNALPKLALTKLMLSL